MLSNLAGKALHARRSLFMRCSGVNTGFPSSSVDFAMVNEALPAGADKTNRAVARSVTNWLRRIDASRLIRLALGLQCVSNSASPLLTRLFNSAEGINRLRLFETQKTIEAP